MKLKVYLVKSKQKENSFFEYKIKDYRESFSIKAQIQLVFSLSVLIS